MQAGQHRRTQALIFSSLLLACLLLPLLLIPVLPPVYLVWDWANALGYMVVAIALLLFVYRGRARRFPAFSGRFFANFHRDLGYIATVFLLAHVGLLLLAEPLLVKHLKPTAPLHMLAGVGALYLMLLLLVSSIPVLRRRLWPDYRLFRKVHMLLASAIVTLVFYHVAVSGFYLDSALKTAALGVVSLGVFASSLVGGISGGQLE